MRKGDRYSQRAAARLELLPGPGYGDDFAELEAEGSAPDAEATASALREFYRPQPFTPAERTPTRRNREEFDDFAAPPRIPTQDEDDELFLRAPRRVAVRRGRLPETFGGRIAFAVSTLLALLGIAALAMGISNYLLHDDHFRLASPDAVQFSGERHVSHAQLMQIFSRDVGRNVFTIPLSDRRAAIESIPWVEHATVMRLLPNRIRVAVMERKPVAYTRDTNGIGLVDANGVLMPMPQNAEPAAISLPVVIGITSDLPLSTRAARMDIYNHFVAAIDSGGTPLSRKLSEVDLSDPDDIKALVPEDGMDVLVHFGNANYLSRFQSFEQHLPEWRAMYPHLASADMRYDHQVVLDMSPGATPLPADGMPAAPVAAPAAAPTAVKPLEPAQKPLPQAMQKLSPTQNRPTNTAAVMAPPAARPVGAATHSTVTKNVALKHPAAKNAPVRSARPLTKSLTEFSGRTAANSRLKTAAKAKLKSGAKPETKTAAKRSSKPARNDDDAPVVLPSISSGSSRSPHKFIPAPVTGTRGLGGLSGGTQ